MGDIHSPAPVWLIAAVFSRHDDAFEWTRAQLVERYGPVALQSPRFVFDDTDYYEPTMGSELRKQFTLLERPIDAATLVDVKHTTNALETAYAEAGHHDEPRPLNIDPGYLTAAKLVLASTKDHAHRIYLDGGIYAEVTLHYQHHQWRAREWTFPDYRRDDYQAFLGEARQYVRQQQTRRQQTGDTA
jgi:hypothetical protein